MSLSCQFMSSNLTGFREHASFSYFVTNRNVGDYGKRLFTKISPGRGVFTIFGHDPLKQLETPSFGKCLHLMAWFDIIWNFFSWSLQLFVARLQSSLHGGVGFWVPLQGGAKTEHRKGSIEEEHLAFTSGRSLLATAIASSCVWWFSRLGNCTEL